MMRRLWMLALVVFAWDVFARVGGGESYSGGGDSGGGGGGGDDGTGELIYLVFRFLLWLTIEHPAIGIPVDIMVVIGLVVWHRNKSTRETLLRVSTKTIAQPVSLGALRRFDPNFSEITFSDFCYSLYGRAHEARGRGDLSRYAPYLSEGARRSLMAQNPRGLKEVRGVIVGAFRITASSGMDTPKVTVNVVYESNYTEVVGTSENSWYAQEQWVLERRRDILSPPPDRAKADHCPRCGAALQTRTDGSCDYCGVKIESGAFQWYVRAIASITREERGPLLTSNVPEQGTNRKTVFQHGFAEKRAQQELDWDAFESRVRFVARELQDAWTSRDWEKARPLETESLFQMHRYWIDAYRRQKLRNVVDDYEVTRVEPVKIDADAFYEAITVRIFAHGRDSTVNESGAVVAGSNTTLRRWSEYWTFIRTKTTANAPSRCPNCGAEVQVGASGVCSFCGGKITAGHFDWILSRIEQDESYGG